VRAAEAKDLVLGLMRGGLTSVGGLPLVGPAAPDGDPAKFLISAKIARAIHHFDGRPRLALQGCAGLRHVLAPRCQAQQA
jgi:hypothetical protein